MSTRTFEPAPDGPTVSTPRVPLTAKRQALALQLGIRRGMSTANQQGPSSGPRDRGCMGCLRAMSEAPLVLSTQPRDDPAVRPSERRQDGPDPAPYPRGPDGRAVALEHADMGRPASRRHKARSVAVLGALQRQGLECGSTRGAPGIDAQARDVRAAMASWSTAGASVAVVSGRFRMLRSDTGWAHVERIIEVDPRAGFTRPTDRPPQ